MPKPKVVFFHTGRRASFQEHLDEFRKGLHSLVPQADVDVVEQFAMDHPERKPVPQQAEDMSNVSDITVLVAAGGPPASVATRDANQKKSTKVPVVFMSTRRQETLGDVLMLGSGLLLGRFYFQ